MKAALTVPEPGFSITGVTVASIAFQLFGRLLPIAEEDSSASVIFWSICLFVLVVVLFGASVILRKKLSPNEDFHGEGFTLSDLRRLHKSGKMSDEEFDRTKQILVAGLQKKTAKAPDPLEPGPNLRGGGSTVPGKSDDEAE